MTFIVTLIALVIERFFDWSHLRNWQWYNVYQQKILARVPNVSGYAALAVVVVPLLLVVAILQFVLMGFMYGLASLIFQVLLMLYCFGPLNLWADAFGTITSLSQGDLPAAGDKLKALFGITESGDAARLHRLLLDGIFVQAGCRVFNVVFWYALLGPVGMLLYRLVTLSSGRVTNLETVPGVAHSAQTVEEIMNWLPARLFTLLFALGGNFVQVFNCWRKKVMLGLSGNDQLVAECGLAALGKEDQDIITQDGAVSRAAISLLDRVFVITLVLVLLVTLMF